MSLTKKKVDGEISKFINQMKDIHNHFLMFIDNPDSTAEKNYINLIKINEKYCIQKNKEVFNHFIGLLVNISNNHHRHCGFFDKIERILVNYKDTIKTHNTNFEIFLQFESNKRLLYFIIKEQILTIDSRIEQIIKNKIEKNGIRYSDFFLPEIAKSDNDKFQNDEKIKHCMNDLEEYEAKRQIGENDSYICSLIREDSIEEFIEHVNRNSISPSNIIKPSIFETNSFLLDKHPSLIEYASFFGSIQIFQYLFDNGAEFDGSLWLYGVHSNDSDLLVNYIQDNHIEPTDKTYKEVLKESIKCNYNDFVQYIESNAFLNTNSDDKNDTKLDELFFEYALKYHNYSFLKNQSDQSYAFFYLCKYNYEKIVDLLIQSKREFIEAKIIQNSFLLIIEFINYSFQ